MTRQICCEQFTTRHQLWVTWGASDRGFFCKLESNTTVPSNATHACWTGNLTTVVSAPWHAGADQCGATRGSAAVLLTSVHAGGVDCSCNYSHLMQQEQTQKMKISWGGCDGACCHLLPVDKMKTGSNEAASQSFTELVTWLLVHYLGFQEQFAAEVPRSSSSSPQYVRAEQPQWNLCDVSCSLEITFWLMGLEEWSLIAVVAGRIYQREFALPTKHPSTCQDVLQVLHTHPSQIHQHKFILNDARLHTRLCVHCCWCQKSKYHAEESQNMQKCNKISLNKIMTTVTPDYK